MNIKRSIVKGAIVAGTSAALAVAGSGVAQAADVRAGAGAGQIDILLDSEETARASSSAWGASVTCWSAGLTGAATGAAVSWWSGVGLLGGSAVGMFGVGLPCVSVVTVCAAEAQAAGRDAGMTISPTGFWCWQYN